MSKWILFSGFYFFTALAFAESGTVVRNGGDPVHIYISDIRNVLNQTLHSIVAHPENVIFCGYLESEMKGCREFLFEAAPQIIKLTEGGSATPLVLRKDPFMVDSHGYDEYVSARTQLGPKGPIEIHRDSVKNMKPETILELLAHEFLHKATFRGKYLSDNGQALKEFDNNRFFIDTVAAAIQRHAIRLGLRYKTIDIWDRFDCTVVAKGLEFGASLKSQRRAKFDGWKEYKTGIGINPLDVGLFYKESANTSLRFRFEISSGGDCPSHSRLYETDSISMDILKTTTDAQGAVNEEVLAHGTSIENPLCANVKEKSFRLSHGGVQFTCTYGGSEGMVKENPPEKTN